MFEKPLYRQVDEAVRLGQIDSHGFIPDDAGGLWGGPLISLNSRGEYFKPRIMQYRFKNYVKLLSPSLFLWKFVEIFSIFPIHHF